MTTPYPPGDLYNVERMRVLEVEDFTRQPGDDDPDEGETITLGEFCASIAESTRRAS